MECIKIESEINFLYITELWFHYLPPDNGAQEEIEIDLIFILDRALSPENMEKLLSVGGIPYDPHMVGHKKELRTIGEILWLKCKNHLRVLELGG